jgi:type IV pilus biogenesis protein CpaD/CtpE
MLRLLATVAIAILLCGCSRQKIVSPDDLRSDLTAAISLASETETFIDYVGQQRATSNFTEGHLAYLAQTARQSAKELHSSTPVGSIAQQFSATQKAIDALAYQLATMRYQLARSPSAADSTRNLGGIRQTLQQIKASL